MRWIKKVSACYTNHNSDCWNGCDEVLKEEIRRNAFVQEIRLKLLKKKCKQILGE